MTIQDIEKKIISSAEAEAEKIKAEAQAQVQDLEKIHQATTAELKAERLAAARQKAEGVKRAILVPARLAAKKALLEEKQQIMKTLYAEIKKDKKLSNAELIKLREDSEVKVANILYG
ncbi:MAG: hypothetical protein ABH823_02260 [bacterium]